MNLWLCGVLSWLQGLAATAASTLVTRPKFRLMAAGAAGALLLFGFLPQSLLLCSPIVLAPSLVLGIILSVFLQESVHRYGPPLWALWLSVYIFLQANGLLPPSSLLYLLPISLSLPHFRVRDMIWLTMAIPSFAMGCIWSISSKWQGLLLSVTCGMMLGCIPYHKNQSFVGGIAIGVILSFL